MKVYLVRHGAYLSDYTSHAGPGLSPLGWDQARAAGAFLNAQGARPTVLLTSGALRAMETAQTIQEVLGTTLDPILSQDFSPAGDAATMKAILTALPADSEVLVVGHMSSIGELAHLLNLNAPTTFGTCTTVALEGTGDDWRLLFFKDCGRGL